MSRIIFNPLERKILEQFAKDFKSCHNLDLSFTIKKDKKFGHPYTPGLFLIISNPNPFVWWDRDELKKESVYSLKNSYKETVSEILSFTSPNTTKTHFVLTVALTTPKDIERLPLFYSVKETNASALDIIKEVSNLHRSHFTTMQNLAHFLSQQYAGFLSFDFVGDAETYTSHIKAQTEKQMLSHQVGKSLQKPTQKRKAL
jgi:hypothetical protein